MGSHPFQWGELLVGRIRANSWLTLSIQRRSIRQIRINKNHPSRTQRYMLGHLTCKCEDTNRLNPPVLQKLYRLNRSSSGSHNQLDRPPCTSEEPLPLNLSPTIPRPSPLNDLGQTGPLPRSSQNSLGRSSSSRARSGSFGIDNPTSDTTTVTNTQLASVCPYTSPLRQINLAHSHLDAN